MSTVYVFYKPQVTIDKDGDRCAHVFHCANRGCDVTIRHWLDKKDRHSTGNLCKHVKACFSEEALGKERSAGNDKKNHVVTHQSISSCRCLQRTRLNSSFAM